MSARVLVILFAILFGVASAGRLINGRASEKQCVDNTLYAKYVCRGRLDGLKLLVPGKCGEYYECSNNQSVKKSCKKFFDPDSQTCVDKSDCVEVDDTDCVIPTPPPCKPTTPDPTCPSCPPPDPGPCGNWFDPNDLYGSFVCRNKADGTMLIVPRKCNDYYFCIGGHSYHKTCGSTRYFNPLVNACDTKELVYCPSG